MAVDELAAAVRFHNYRYFALDAPVLSDVEFDALTRRLRDLAPDHPALGEIPDDAAPQDGARAAAGTKVVHDHPMLSLDKCYSEAELSKWADTIQGEIVASPKIDGVAASFRYDHRGALVLATTRGDGRRGEAFTEHAKHITDLPTRLPGGAQAGPVEVRGEVYLRLSMFRSLEGDFSSPRNTAAGALKQKDPAKTAGYGLTFFLYDVLGRPFETELDKAAWARSQGFTPTESALVPRDALQAHFEAWEARRPSLDYEIDGVVYKANRTAEHERLGLTAHHPRYAIAYKLQGDQATTRLQDVEWSVSRTGAITPVGIVAPVRLSGAVVTRASLHNLSVLRELGATLGATVVAVRRGGVIPHIERVVEPGDAPIAIPSACPSCGAPTEERPGHEGVLFCSQPADCPAAIRGTIQHFTRLAGIDGFGPKIIDQLVERGLVREPADLYRLRPEDLTPLERMGETLARKLVDNAQGRRRLPLATFLRALGVDDLGSEAASWIAEAFGTLDAVQAARPEAIAEIHGLGDTTAASIRAGLDARAEQIAALRQVVAVQDAAPPAPAPERRPEDDDDTDDLIRGRSFVFTGTMASMDRKTAQAAVRARGGKTPSGVSKSTDYVVVGDKASALTGDGPKSSKHKKAEALASKGAPIELLTEAAFLKLLAASPDPGTSP